MGHTPPSPAAPASPPPAPTAGSPSPPPPPAKSPYRDDREMIPRQWFGRPSGTLGHHVRVMPVRPLVRGRCRDSSREKTASRCREKNGHTCINCNGGSGRFENAVPCSGVTGALVAGAGVVGAEVTAANRPMSTSHVQVRDGEQPPIEQAPVGGNKDIRFRGSDQWGVTERLLEVWRGLAVLGRNRFARSWLPFPHD